MPTDDHVPQYIYTNRMRSVSQTDHSMNNLSPIVDASVYRSSYTRAHQHRVNSFTTDMKNALLYQKIEATFNFTRQNCANEEYHRATRNEPHELYEKDEWNIVKKFAHNFGISHDDKIRRSEQSSVPGNTPLVLKFGGVPHNATPTIGNDAGSEDATVPAVSDEAVVPTDGNLIDADFEIMPALDLF